MDAGFRFSDRTEDVDRATVHRWLSEQSYWAEGRSRERMEAAIAGSRNFGVYRDGGDDDGAQVAYARVITDGATFGWLCDVFVDPAVRGAGIGIALIDGVTRSLEPLGIPRILLATRDAHGLYARFGWEPLAEPARWMARMQP